jgi:TonB-dependent SusC/RagA subfamily outer membrane receptor
MKIILMLIMTLFSLTSTAGVCDTLGFKVNVPKISKADDRVVGIKITFDSSGRKLQSEIHQKHNQIASLGDISVEKPIRIHCLASYASEKPLIVIDGVVADDRSSAHLNPERIESIYILKNATAQKLYGCRATGGVILITTKKDRAIEMVSKKIAQPTNYSTKAKSLRIYPNLIAEGASINIELPGLTNNHTKILFYNFSGQIVFQQQLNPGSNIHRMQLPNLAAGIYEVVTSDNLSQKKYTGKLVVL